MSHDTGSWDLPSLIDFEQQAASGVPTPASLRAAVVKATGGLGGVAARRAGLRVWLSEMPPVQGGRKFLAALGWVTRGLAVAAFFVGISAALGMVDRARGGVNVTLFLALLIGGQWLVLALATLAWLLRRRASDGFTLLQAAAAHLTRHLAAGADEAWWSRLMDGGAASRAAILWRFARTAQTAGIFFNLGIVAGLVGAVLVKNVGFFWETTTEAAMRAALQTTVDGLSVPWAAWLPGAVPSPAVIDATRWLPGRSSELSPGPSEWWQFLLMTTLVWGLLPRAMLWLLAWQASRKAIDQLDFQGRHHRVLWREITGAERARTDEPALDGALVLDVGGSNLSEAKLRPFLLRRLRVNPTAWCPVGVLDTGAEEEAARALAKAPAGVVLLAEGWSLSPPKMVSLHQRIRASTDSDVPIRFLILNQAADGEPTAISDEEQREWSRFVDSLRDPSAEVFFFESDQRGL